MMDKFFDNIRKVREAGCSFSLELTPSDEVISEIEEMKKICLDQVGALCHVTVARDNTKYELPILTNYSREEYKKIWSQFDSKMFEYKLSVFNQKRREFCYAGDWTCTLDLATGDLRQCYCGEVLQKVFDNIDSPIHFRPVGYRCPESHCYNAHAFLTFGAIPEHKAPFYAEMRNRVTKDGSEWLTPRMKAFLSTKLKESNKEYAHKLFVKNCLESLFSVKNENNHKVVRLAGLKVKLKK